MSKSRFIRLGLVLGVSGAFALGLASAAPAAASTGAVSVEGAHLMRDGAIWLPRGVQIVGMVAPKGSLYGKYVDANAHFGIAELQAAGASHADTIRFQVSRYGLDPSDPLYSKAYVQQVHDAVEQARGLGLTVIVSLQAQEPAGRAGGCPLPDVGAERAWQQLAPMFASDDGVMFELYNEPSLGATPANWQMWEYGGLVTQPSGAVCQEVGMQTLINDIRSDGANNVIIVPGLGGESTLQGMPILSDPASPSSPQLAYGIHYPSLMGGATLWDRKFGAASTSVPVIVTEWYSSSVHDCVAGEPAKAAELLAYLASKQIGVVGYAFDVPGTIVSGWSYAPTTYANFHCGTPGAGPGQLLFDEFGGLEQADGPSLDDPHGWVMSYAAVQRLGAVAPGLVRHFFDTPRAFVVGAGAGSLRQLGLEAAIPTASFTSVGTLAAAVNGHTLRAGTRAVIFDDENWQRTPRSQQLHPDFYYRRAARIAHTHGLLLVAAPDPSLVMAREPKVSTRRMYARFLGLRIPAAAARYADVYDIRADGLQSQRSAYTWFVQSAAFQAAQTHPGVELLAGMSSGPPARKHSFRTLLGAFSAAGPAVSGYWLTDPQGGCALCASPYDGAVLGFLRALRSEGI